MAPKKTAKSRSGKSGKSNWKKWRDSQQEAKLELAAPLQAGLEQPTSNTKQFVDAEAQTDFCPIYRAAVPAVPRHWA